MRNLLTFSFTFLISIATLSQPLTRPLEEVSFSATNLRALVDTGIDPRKYVTVIFKKSPDTKTEDALAIWNWDSYARHQKYKVLDKDGFVEIYFNKEKLAADIQFRGNLSLVATVKGKAGERNIEIVPYSKVGENLKSYGTNTISPELTAQLLFNTIFSIKKTLATQPNLLSYSTYDYTETYKRYEDVISEITTGGFKEKKKSEAELSNQINLDKIFDAATYDAAIESISKKFNKDMMTYGQLSKALELILNDMKSGDASYKKRKANEMVEKIRDLVREISMVNSYFDAFEQAGPDAQAVFLRLINSDIVKFKELKKIFKLSFNFLTSSVSTEQFERAPLDGQLERHIKTVNYVLSELSEIEGSEFNFLINRYFNNAGASAINDTSNLFRDTIDTYSRMKSLKQRNLHYKLIQELSLKAGKLLFSLLTYGSINLAKNDVKEGDILYLNIVWRNFKDHVEDSIRQQEQELLPIGTYKIEQTGWSTNVSESFYLVDRINEPDRLIDDRVSPSNFKGAAGVSLMRTYNYSEPNAGAGNRFFNWLQPSIGLNLSYIDFYTTKDLELGLGFQVGLFKNSIFLGYGINLNGIRGGEDQNTYFMLGLSFINLASKFTSTK